MFQSCSICQHKNDTNADIQELTQYLYRYDIKQKAKQCSLGNSLSCVHIVKITLRKTTLPAISLLMDSSFGAIILQGPHQVAKKSTTTRMSYNSILVKNQHKVVFSQVDVIEATFRFYMQPVVRFLGKITRAISQAISQSSMFYTEFVLELKIFPKNLNDSLSGLQCSIYKRTPAMAVLNCSSLSTMVTIFTVFSFLF